MVVLSAGIRSLLWTAKGADLSRPAEAPDPRARSSRNGGRHHLGTVGEIISEWVGGIIPESWAASPGISSESQSWQSWHSWKPSASKKARSRGFSGLGCNYHLC